jgi:hypothetical protein
LSAGRTAVIVTTARSGSSLLSGVLHRLGVCMGEDEDLGLGRHLNPLGCFEDQEFQRISLNILLESDLLLDLSRRLAIDEARLERVVRRYRRAVAEFVSSRQQRVWGFKDPGLVYSLPYLHDLFPEPRYIHLERDPGDTARSLYATFRPGGWFPEMREKFPLFSPANRVRLILKAAKLLVSRRSEYVDQDFFERVIRAGHERARLFLEDKPSLYVRLDQLVADSAGAVDQLSGFLGIDPGPAEVEQALAFVHPEMLHSNDTST